VGLHLELAGVPYAGPPEHRRDAVLLFSESNSRFLAEVPLENVQDFEEMFEGLACAAVGTTEDSGHLTMGGLDGTVLFRCSLEALKAAWQRPLLPH
jgi:phosphoribosylformylglycinamidine synthase